MSGSRRRAILDAHGLALSRRAVQEAFWQRYNSRRWREPAAIGGIIDGMLADGLAEQNRALSSLRDVWPAVVPAELAGRSEPAGFSRGRLEVTVASKADQYVLKRALGPTLVSALNAAQREVVVRRVQFRLRGADGTAPDRRGLARE